MTHTAPAPTVLEPPAVPVRGWSFFTWYSVAAHAAVSAVLAAILLLLEVTASRGDVFWAGYPIMVLGAVLLMHAAATVVVHGPRPVAASAIRAHRVRGLAIGMQLAGALIGSVLALQWGIWLAAIGTLTRSEPPWPLWPTLGIVLILGAARITTFVQTSSRRYAGRIDQLAQSRAGVVAAQELELRRIERDLHDGAQARLVALGMQLGQAEQQLDRSPERARELIAEARATTLEALRELRDLARGIYPPVLADRGLVPAIQSLVSAGPLEVAIDAGLAERLPAAVEGALYFTVAEGLANAGKHARCEHVDIVVRRGAFDVVLELRDDGVGGADPAGSGLMGIRQRIEALDGRLSISSPAGGPTTLRAELPCAS